MMAIDAMSPTDIEALITRAVQAAVPVRCITNPANVKEVAERMLRWTADRREASTLATYERHLSGFIEQFGDRDMRELTPLELSDFINSRTTLSRTTKHSLGTAIKRLFNWAVKMQLLESSVMESVELPKAEPSERWATQAEVIAIRQHGCPEFSRLVRFCWLTGARPQEVRKIKIGHFDAAKSLVLFARNESKGQQQRRVLRLTSEAKAIITDAIGGRTDREAIVFLNTDGRAWTKDSTRQHFARLEQRGHLTRRLTMYSIRHGFAGDALESRVEPLFVAELMGHSSLDMLKRTYGHLSQRDELLREGLERRRQHVVLPDGITGERRLG